MIDFSPFRNRKFAFVYLRLIVMGCCFCYNKGKYRDASAEKRSGREKEEEILYFFEKLPCLRKNVGLSQDALAKQLGVSRQAISKWESGIAYPDLEKVQALCALFGCSADALLNPAIEDPALPAKGEIFPSAVGENIKRVRMGEGMAQETLAERLNVSRQSVSKWETGLAVPKTETLIAMLPIFRCSMDELLLPLPKSDEAPVEAGFASEEAVAEPIVPTEQIAEAKSVLRKKRPLWIAAAGVLLLSAFLIIFLCVRLGKQRGESVLPTDTDPTDSTVTVDDTETAEPQETPIVIWDGSADTSWYSSKYAEFEISTPQQLAGLARLVNWDGVDFANKTIRLQADLRFDAMHHWTPIGSDEAHAFCGTFDGNGHEISGLTVSGSGSVGLFGVVWGGTVKNVVLKNASVQGGEDVGGICGLALSKTTENPVTVHNCRAEAVEVSGVQSVGGIVGRLCAQNGTAVIERCDFSGKVRGDGLVGGICGSSEANGTGATGKVINCLGGGEVYNSAPVDTTAGGFGGVLGKGSATGKGRIAVERCIHEGAVCQGTDAKSVGGIVGDISSPNSGFADVKECYNTGNVCSDTDASVRVGGIVGNASSYGIVISDCYQSGKIYAEYYCGGICGYFYGTGTDSAIRRCVFLGDIVSTLDWIDESILYGSNWKYFSYYQSFGGIAGYCNGGVSGQRILVSCYAKGKITAQYKGGLVGEQASGNARWYYSLYCVETAGDYTAYGARLAVTECGYFTAEEGTDRWVFHERIEWPQEHWDTSGDIPVLIR